MTYRVLVVDDDVDIRDLITLRLRMDGHEVNALGDPVAALSLAGTTAFDMAVLDWSMPAMDGGHLCARLRELPGHRDTPILVATAHADPDIRDRAFDAGASAYMAKPFSVRELSVAVGELLRPGAMSSAGGTVRAPAEGA